MHFMIQGTAQDPHLYHKGEESTRIVASSHIYEGSAAIRENNECITYLIDNAIEVIARKPKDCAPHVNYWQSKRTEALIVATGAVVVGIGGCVALAASPIAATAVGISALASTSLGGYRAAQAHDQVKQWDTNLLEKVCAQRKQAGDFEYVFDNQLKDVIVHPEEIKVSWEKAVKNHLNQFFQRPLSTADVNNFFNKNPLDQKRRLYAAGEIDPSLASTYDNCKTRFRAMNQAIEKQKTAIQQKADQQILGLKQDQEIAIAGDKREFESACTPHLAKKSKRDEQIKTTPSNSLADIEKQQRSLRESQCIYEQAISSHKAVYEDKTRPIVRRYEDLERGIYRQRDLGLEQAENERESYSKTYMINIQEICHQWLGIPFEIPAEVEWGTPAVAVATAVPLSYETEVPSAPVKACPI